MTIRAGLGVFAWQRRACLAVALVLLAFAGAAPAEELYRQDFQKGAPPGWTLFGGGDVEIWTYLTNVSVKFSRQGGTQTTVFTRGSRGVIIRAKIAALALKGDDACYAEVSADGAQWLTVLSVHHGQDDGVRMVDGALADPRLDGQTKLLIRFRADLKHPNAACWGDDVVVTGDPAPLMHAGAVDGALLLGAKPMDGLFPAAIFAPRPAAGAPAARFEGRLELHPDGRVDGLLVLAGDIDPSIPDPRRDWPDLAIDLVQDGARLIPAQRGPFPSKNRDWEWLVQPGMAWTDPADQGFTRAALPVTLEERNANCVHNGHLLLLFKADGTVSRAAVQFDAETCAYDKFDAYALVPAAYKPGPVAGAQALIDRDRAERAGRLPLKPIDQLPADHPGVDLVALSRAAGPGAVWGAADQGTLYAAPCPTRVGDDPLCAERDLPSYSTAKTLVGAQALMRLEALKPGASRETVGQHVPACAANGTWNDVKLIDLLDMTSGHFNSADGEADEDAPANQVFFTSDTAAEKIAFVCGMPRKAAPEAKWVYHTWDSYLLGVAMTDVIRKAGLGQDVYDDLVRPIWAGIGQSAVLDHTRRTYDAVAQPFTGWGLTYHRDDIVRAMRFLDQGGEIGGKPYLDPHLLSDALQRAKPGSGFVALAPNLRYRHGFWARDVGPLIGCGHAVWVPYMSGYGGISVVLFPNDVQFFSYTDENWFDWAAAVPEVNKIRPLCK